MSTVHQALLAMYAVVESFVSGRHVEQVMKQFNVQPGDFNAAQNTASANAWRGRYAEAMLRHERPEIIGLYRQLASLEYQHSVLMFQFQRAEETCLVVSRQQADDLALRFKVEAFAFRVGQAAARIIKDIAKAESTLQKALAEPPITANSSGSSKLASAKRESPVAANDSHAIHITTPTSPSQTVTPPLETTSNLNTPETSALPGETTGAEIASFLLRHRQRIKNTNEKDRPALIAKLIEQEKEKRQEKQALRAA